MIPMRTRSVAVAVFAAAPLYLFAGAGTAEAKDYDVSVADYCAKNVKSGTSAPSQATNVNNKWTGWACGTRWGPVGVQMDVACAQQHPGSAAKKLNDSMFGWKCRT